MSAVAPAATPPETLYASSWPRTIEERASVFKSTDGGGTWLKVLDAVEFDAFRSLTVDSGSAEHVYAGTQSSYFFRSEDAGTSWSCVTGVWAGGVFGIAVDPLSSATLYAASSQTVGIPEGPFICSVVKSTDFGRTWATVPGLPQFGFSSVAIDPASPHRLYASATDMLYRSEDGGLSWTPITNDPTPIFVLGYAFDPLRPRHFYVAPYAGVYDIELFGRLPVAPPGASSPRVPVRVVRPVRP